MLDSHRVLFPLAVLALAVVIVTVVAELEGPECVEIVVKNRSHHYLQFFSATPPYEPTWAPRIQPADACSGEPTDRWTYSRPHGMLSLAKRSNEEHRFRVKKGRLIVVKSMEATGGAAATQTHVIEKPGIIKCTSKGATLFCKLHEHGKETAQQYENEPAPTNTF